MFNNGDTILSAIGNTPLVELKHINPNPKVRISQAWTRPGPLWPGRPVAYHAMNGETVPIQLFFLLTMCNLAYKLFIGHKAFFDWKKQNFSIGSSIYSKERQRNSSFGNIGTGKQDCRARYHLDTGKHIRAGFSGLFLRLSSREKLPSGIEAT